MLPSVHLTVSTVLISLNNLISNYSEILVINYEEKLEQPTIIYNFDKEINNFLYIKPDVYLIKSRNNLQTILGVLEKRTWFNPTAEFILITEEENLVEILRDFYIEKAIVYQDSSPKKLVLVYDPKLLKVGHSDNIPSVILSNDVVTSGIDVEILDLIAGKLEISIEYVQVGNFVGKKNMVNFSYDGALGALEGRMVDLVVGGIFGTSQSTISFELTQPTVTNYYTWILPSAKFRPFWKRVILTFNATVWTLFLVTFVVNLSILIIGNKLILQTSTLYGEELLRLYSMWLSPFTIKSSELLSKRVIYMFWCSFLLVYSNFFTAKLLSNLIAKKFEYQINSMDEILKSNLNICLFWDFVESMSFEEEHRIISCTNCEICTNRTAYQRDLVTIRSRNLVQYDMARLYLNKYDEPLLYFSDNISLVVFDVMVFRKNHPMYGKFNKIIEQLINSGLAERIRKKYAPKKPVRHDVTWNGLKLMQLNFMFKFLFFGLIVAFIVLILEFSFKPIF